MVDHMWHLDLLLQLQGEMFTRLLQDIVSIFISFLIVALVFVFAWGFRGCCHRQCSHYLISFQKWPQVDISPIESLLVVFAYEKQMGEMVSVEEIHNGSLGPKLSTLTQHSRYFDIFPSSHHVKQSIIVLLVTHLLSAQLVKSTLKEDNLQPRCCSVRASPKIQWVPI